MRLSRWPAIAGPILLTAACSMEREAAPKTNEAPATTAAAPATTAAAAPATTAAPLAPGQGERAPFVVEGDLVKVNNTHCGVTRSPMGPETLGRFTTRVQYKGADPRFQGKTLEFNQCCGMCIEKFPTLWAERADEILAYHGLSEPGRRVD